MADLVDLAYTKAELKEEAKEQKFGEPSKYPWGLQIRLEEEELKKLGIKDLPQVGGELHLAVIAKVTGVSENTMADGDYDCCVTLQLTMMQVVMNESAEEEKGEKDTPAYEAKETRGKTASILTKY